MTANYLLNKQDIEEIKSKIAAHEWAAKLFERVKNDRTFESMNAVDVIDGGDIAMYFRQEGRWLFNRALAFAVSGTDEEIPRLIEILTQRFLKEWEFPSFQEFKRLAVPLDFDSIAGYWMFWQMLANHVYGFSLIKDHPAFSSDLLSQFERVFRKVIELKKKEYDNLLALYNCQFWDVTCLGMLGFLVEDQDAVNLAINGKYGFKHMLERFYDGLFWPEAQGYGYGYISTCALMLAEGSLQSGYEDLYQYVSPSGASIKSMFDGFTSILLTDGRMATSGDSGQSYAGDYYLTNKCKSKNNKLEIAYRRYEDPVYAWVLSMEPDRDTEDVTFWGYSALTHGIPLGETKPPSAQSRVFKQYGAALIRSDETDNYWHSDAMAVYLRDGSRQGHSHDDHYGILLNAYGKNIYPDLRIDWDYKGMPDTKTGKNRNTRAFSRSIAGHNTIMVDGVDPEFRNVKILPLRRVNGMQVLRVEGSVDGGAYRRVYQTRILGVVKEYLLDIFDIRCEVAHTYDYLLHSFGKLQAADIPDMAESDHQDLRDEFNFHEIDSSSESPDNYWIGPGTRGTSDADWGAVFIDTDGIGSQIRVAGNDGTDVVTSSTPYYVSKYGLNGTAGEQRPDRRPLLIIRRKTQSTTFVVVHMPFRDTIPVIAVRRTGSKVIISGDGFSDEFDLTYLSYKRTEKGRN